MQDLQLTRKGQQKQKKNTKECNVDKILIKNIEIVLKLCKNKEKTAKDIDASDAKSRYELSKCTKNNEISIEIFKENDSTEETHAKVKDSLGLTAKEIVSVLKN